MRKSNLDSDTRAYRTARNRYCFHLKEAKRKQYGGVTEDCAGGSKKLFSTVNSLCNVRTDTLPPHENLRLLANKFGELFCRKISLIREDISSCSFPEESIALYTGVLGHST